MSENSLILVKIGGSVAESSESLTSLVAALCDIVHAGQHVVLVHGGGAEISRNLKLLDQEPLFIDGLRVTRPDDLKMVEMTLSGHINKMLVSLFHTQGNAFGLKAVGLSGVDAQTFICEPISENLGQVGRITSVQTTLVSNILNIGMIPVLSPISTDKQGIHYNVNADEAARALAMALGVDKLVFVSDVPGVLNENGACISFLSESEIGALVSAGVVKGGMIPKLKACIEVAASGVKEVHICGWKNSTAFKEQLTAIKNTGTIITM